MDRSDEDSDPSEVEELSSEIQRSTKGVRVGGVLSRHAPCFSLDGKILFCCMALEVKLFSVASGQEIGALRGHTRVVTCVLTNPHNSLQVYSASLDGTIRVWDFYESSCLAVHPIGLPILHLALCKGNFVVNVNKTYASKKLRNESSCRIGTYPVDASADSKLALHFRSKACKGMAISPCQSNIVTIAKTTITIWDVALAKRIKYSHVRSLTTVAIHPTEPYLATGDTDGQIILWYRYQDQSKVVTSTLHWHAHAVQSLSFSEDGAYLISGGEEAVLVMWQLGTGNKQFLPRLGSSIQHISVSPDGNQYALAGGDNSIRIVNAVTTAVQQHIKGLQHAHNHPTQASARGLLTGLHRDPRTNFLVLGGMPGVLQFYDVFYDKHIMELDVSNQNRVSRTDGKALAMTRVEHVALSKGSSWLAAVERRVNGETSDSMCLKFYAYDPTSSTYVLNSFIEHPHKDRVVALTFHPHLNIVVTVGADKEFKVWQTTAQAARSSMAGAAAVPARSTWSCRSVGQYRNFHAHDCSFSPDGSLLAVAHGQVVTLWDALTMTLQHTLLHPPPAEYVRKVSFLSEGAHLIAVTRDVLYVWNLLTSSVWWSCEIKCSALTVDPFSKHFAVLTTPPTDSIEEAEEEEEEEAAPAGEAPSKNKVKRQEKKAKEERLHTKRVERKERQTGTQVVLFSPDHPAPVYVWAASDVRLEADAACPGLMKSHLAFVYSKQRGDSHTAACDAASLVYLNRHLELTRLDGVYTAEPTEGEALEASPDAAATSLAAMKGQPDPLSAFQKLYGKDYGKGSIGVAVASGMNGELALDADFVARSEARPTEGVRGLLSAPAHVIPPMSKLYHSFMGMVLQKAESSTHSHTNTTTTTTSTTTTTTTTANGYIDASASTTTTPISYNAHLTDEALFTRDVNDVDGFRTQQANTFLSALLSASTLSQSPSKRKRAAKPAATPRAPDNDAASDAESRPVKAKATPKKANATPNRKSKRPN